MQGASGNNHSDLTEMNRSAVVTILQQRAVCSRADIARETGLTQAAITKIVAALMARGIVSEVGSIKGGGNRRSIGIQLNADRHQVIGVKLGRLLFAVGVFDISGKLYTQAQTPYAPDASPSAVLAAIKQQIHSALQRYKNVVAIGLAVPGPYLRTEGRIAVVTQMPAWRNINFIEAFDGEFKQPVFIEHDAKAGALAAWWFGAHPKPISTLAYLLVGDGVGAGVIENGRLLLGAQGTACEIGHTSVDVHGARCECGNYGCLELYCSASALVTLAQQRAPECLTQAQLQSRDAHNAVFAAARAGNPNAMEVVREIAQYIGYGCVSILHAYNPDVIVIGDSVSQGGDLLLPILQSVVNERAIPQLGARVRIEISRFSVDSTLYGAAALATDRVLRMPSAFSATSGSKPTPDCCQNSGLQNRGLRHKSKQD